MAKEDLLILGPLFQEKPASQVQVLPQGHSTPISLGQAAAAAAGSVTQVVPGLGIGVDPPGGTTNVIITNTGVTSITAGAGISVSGSTGDVTISATGGGGGGSLVGFTASLNTAAPNDSINASALIASDGTTTQDAILGPKGDGAFMLQIPDDTTVGGIKRGKKAVDLQLERTIATQVASGQYSWITGGQACVSTGNFSGVGGKSCIATGVSAQVSGGDRNSALGFSSIVAGGALNITGQDYDIVAGGSTNWATGGASAVIGGSANIATGTNSVCLGTNADTWYNTGRVCIGVASGIQISAIPLYVITGDATPIAMSADGNAPNTFNQYRVMPKSSSSFSGRVVARDINSGDTSAWSFVGCSKRAADTSASATATFSNNSLVGAYVSLTDTFVWSFVTALSAIPNSDSRLVEVLIGATLADSLTNLLNAMLGVNFGSQRGTTYSYNAMPIRWVYPTVDTGTGTLTFTDISGFGALANDLSVNSSGPIVWNNPTLTGGVTGTVSLIAPVTPTVIAQDIVTEGWGVSVDVDTTNGTLAIIVTGENDKTIQWCARIESEDSYAR